MKRYPKYKDSGISWLGQIPEHWEVKQLRSFLKLFSEKGHADSQLLSVTREQGVIQRDVESKEENHNYIPEDLSGYKYIEKGDFVINKMKAWQGSYAVSDYDGIVSPAYYTCKLSGVNSRFFTMAIRSKVYVSFFAQYSKGIRVGQWDLETEALKAIPFFFPPLNEQQKIDDFLDSKISKIDSYISEKEKEVKLLAELKQSQIAQVVTKGINPNVPMKDSGISWIGQIPEHWEIKRAKFMFKKHKRPCSPNDEVITCFRDGQVTLRKNRRTTGFTESEKYDGYQGIKKGDLVIHQMDAFAGSIGVSDSNGMGTSVYHCCTPLGDYSVYYYAYLIRQMALSGYIQSLYKGIRERSSDFSFPIFGNQFLVIPPFEEQKAIVEYINTKCQSIDSMISNLESEIAYLKEYKQSLIADAVTGAINVQ